MKQFKIIIFGVIMAALLSVVSGCKVIGTTSSIEAIEKGLYEKYHKTFTVAAFGDRYNKDTATAYVYADDEPTMRFVARVNSNGELVFDDYVYRCNCRFVENTVNEAFKRYDISTECFVDFSNRYDAAITESISEYIKESGSIDVAVAILCRSSENLSGKNIKTIYENLSKEIDIKFGTMLYVLTEQDYDLVSEKIRCETQLFDSARVEIYGAKDEILEINVIYDSGGMSLTEAQIDEKLSEEVE